MRLFCASCALSLALAAMAPLTATAKGPSGGGSGGSGGSGSSGYSGSWHPGQNWWNPGYGYGYGWRSDYYQPYVAAPPSWSTRCQKGISPASPSKLSIRRATG